MLSDKTKITKVVIASVAPIQIAWELHEANQPVGYVAAGVGAYRSAIYRWLKGIQQWGIQGLLRQHRNAKKGRRRRKTDGYIALRVLTIRRKHYDFCGEEIVYWLVH